MSNTVVVGAGFRESITHMELGKIPFGEMRFIWYGDDLCRLLTWTPEDEGFNVKANLQMTMDNWEKTLSGEGDTSLLLTQKGAIIPSEGQSLVEQVTMGDVYETSGIYCAFSDDEIYRLKPPAELGIDNPPWRPDPGV